MKKYLFLITTLFISNIAMSQQQNVNPNVDEILVICKTHFDIGYTHRVNEIVDYYRGPMIDLALNIMDESKSLPKDQQFRWISPGWVMKKVVEDWDGQTPERSRRIDEAIKDRRLIVHAMPFTPGVDGVDMEYIARGFHFSDTISKQYNIPIPRDAKTTDVPSQTRGLATALAHGGVKFIHIGCNWPSGYLHDMPPLFWWEGPDGSKVLCIYSPVYGTTRAMNGWGKEESVGNGIIPTPTWPYKIWPAIIVTPDNAGPPKAEDIKKLFVEAQQLYPNVTIRMGTMEEFADKIIASKIDLPIVTDESTDTWIHGNMCDPRGIEKMRNIGVMLPAFEMLNTQMKSWSANSSYKSAESEVLVAFENYMLYGEHTWGGARSINEYADKFKQLTEENLADLQSSWEDKSEYINKAYRLMTKFAEKDLETLAKSVKKNGARFIVYNPTPWIRSGVVDVNGTPVYVEDIPASGYKTFTMPKKKSVKEGGSILENAFYRIAFNADESRITSLYDKRLKRELVDSESSYGLGQYMNERFDKKQTDGYCEAYQQGRWPNYLHDGMTKKGLPETSVYRAATPKKGVLKITNSGIEQIATIKTPADVSHNLPATELTVTLNKYQPYIDIKVTILDKAKDNWPEADWISLPFNIKDPEFCVARPLGYMDPKKDIIKGGDKHYYAVGPGVMITGKDGVGVAVSPLDHPMISLGEPGLWKFSLDYVPQKANVFINLYNNMWNTNFRYWYTGDWSSRVRIWSVDNGTDKAKSLNIPAMEGRMPLQVATATGEGGNMPLTQQGVKVSRKGVVVTAHGIHPITKKTILRVWDMTGNGGSCSITLPDGMKIASVEPVNLRCESIGDRINVINNNFEFNLNGFAPATFVLD